MYKLITVEEPTLAPGDDFNIVPTITSKTITEQLGLDQWHVEKLPNYKPTKEPVENSFHIMRVNDQLDSPHNGLILAPYVKNTYTPLQYPVGLTWLDYFLEEQLLTVNSVFYMNTGSNLAVTCDIGLEEDVVKGDTMSRYLNFVLSHDNSRRFIGFSDTCIVCMNTLQQASLATLSDKTKGFTLDNSNPDASLKAARKLVNLAETRFYDSSLPLYRALSLLKMEPRQTDFVFRTCLNMPYEGLDVSDKLREQYEVLNEIYRSSPGQELRGEDTAWSVVNAVSRFTQKLAPTALDSYRLNYQGRGPGMRKNALEMVSSLLPGSYIPTLATV
jgi:Domain of unknown function (DUF932)